MMNKIRCTALGLATMLFTIGATAQSKATITIKKNINGVQSEETQSIVLDEGRSIEDVLSEMGVMDEFGNLKEGQQFEIKIDKSHDGQRGSINLSIAPDLNMFPPAFRPSVVEKRPFLGVRLKEEVEYNGDKEKRFVEVSQVEPGSAAEKAGIQAGDIIAQLNDEDIHTSTEFVKAIQTKAIGDKVKVTVLRDGKKKKLNATLGEKAMEIQRPFGNGSNSFLDENGNIPFYNFRFGPDSITILSPRKDSVKICQPFAWNNGDMELKETAFLGVTPATWNGEKPERGVRINVEPQTAAEAMGLLDEDIIISFNAIPINNFAELSNEIKAAKPESEATIIILREGKEKEIKGALGKKSCSNMDDFRIFHDFKGMDEGGNYQYDYEFDMDVQDLEKHMEELLQHLDSEQLMLDQHRDHLEEELEKLRFKESIVINIRIDEISAEEKATLNQQANPKLGNENNLSFEHISFYPNPNNGLLNLNFGTSEAGMVKIVLYDAKGNTVYLEERTLTDNKYQNTIDISDQPNGAYYLQIMQGGKTYSKKIIKNG